MKHLDRVERDLDLARRQPAGIMDLLQGVQRAEGQPKAAGPPPPQASREKTVVQRDAPPRQPTRSMQGKGYCDALRDSPKRWSMPAPAPNESHVYQPEPEPGVQCAPDSGARQRKSKTYTEPALCNFVAKRMNV